MVLVFLKEHRHDFYAYLQNHIFDYREIYDLDIQSEFDYDYLLTDTKDVPQSIRQKTIFYGCSQEGITISSFDQLTRYIGVLSISTPSCVIPESSIIATIEEAWYCRPAMDPDDFNFKFEFPNEQQEIVVTVPSVATSVVQPKVAFEPVAQSVPEVKLQKIDITEPTYEQPVNEQPQIVFPVEQSRQRPMHQYATRSARGSTALNVDSAFESAAPTRHFSSLAEVNQRPVSVSRGSINDALRIGRHAAINTNTANLFFGVTPDSGVTSLCYLLAQKLSSMFPEQSVCLVDLDIIKPDLTSMISKITGLDSRTDANILNLAQLTTDDWIDNQSYLVSEISVGPSRFDFIAHTTTGFADKRVLSAYDYMPKIEMLRDAYDFVIVDAGRIQATADYQLMMMASLHTKVLVADGTSRTTLLAFLRDVVSINVDYSIVINKLSRNITPAVLERQLAREVSASLPVKNSLEPFILNGNMVDDIGDSVFARNLLSIIEGVVL